MPGLAMVWAGMGQGRPRAELAAIWPGHVVVWPWAEMAMVFTDRGRAGLGKASCPGLGCPSAGLVGHVLGWAGHALGWSSHGLGWSLLV
jgi:hypothetical protein